jgi:large subunit ribosomal protein L25
MSQEVVIEVASREGQGKNAARRLRAEGMIPSVVYGGGREPEAVSVDPRPVQAVIDSDRGLNTLIHLRIGERELRRMVMIRQVQRHPLTERLMHCDFVRVEMDQPLEVDVPVNLVGTPEGVKNEGGLLEFVRRQVTIRVLPERIPDELDADISGLHVGQHLEAGDVPLPEGIELITPPTETLCTLVGRAAAVTAEEEAEEAEAAEAAEAEEGEAEAAEETEEPAG